MTTKKEIDELAAGMPEGPLLRIINLMAGELFKLRRRVEKLEGAKPFSTDSPINEDSQSESGSAQQPLKLPI